MSKRQDTLERILERSPYFEFLCRHIASIGFKFPDCSEVVLLAGKQGQRTPLAEMLGLSSSNIGIVDIQSVEQTDESAAEIWVEFDESEWMELAEKGTPVSKMRISATGIHPRIETMVQRIFFPLAEGYPLADRIELIYGSMFGFQEPQWVWKSERKDLFVLKYERVYNGLDAYITAGFTNPELGRSAIEFEDRPVSGYGYELMILAEPEDTVYRKELIGWANHVVETGKHIYPGEYLSYKEERIAGTDLGGFIVVPPIDFPEIIPVGAGYGRLNLLLGVTAQELNIAKYEDDIYIVADRLFEEGYINFTPTRRGSVL